MRGIDYDCDGCGRRHEGTDGTEDNPWPVIDLARPEAYLRMDPWEQLTRVRSTEELCLIDNGGSVDCFLKGFLSLPVHGDGARLLYSPWVRVSETDYLDLVENWEHPRYRGSYLGTLASELPGHEDSLAVPMRVTAPGRLPPVFVPEPGTDHALVHEESEGISRQEAELRIRSMLLDDEAAGRR